jgi:hypothetical protein
MNHAKLGLRETPTLFLEFHGTNNSGAFRRRIFRQHHSGARWDIEDGLVRSLAGIADHVLQRH